MPNVVFDPAAHTYTVDGKDYPAVSRILKGTGFIDDSWYTDHAAERGTAVHLACRYLDEGGVDPESIDPEIEPYVKAYEKFKCDTGFAPRLIEHSAHSDFLEYAGTLDRVGQIAGRGEVLIDLKTGSSIPTWVGVQLAAYAGLVRPDIERFALQLKPDGRYKVHKFEDEWAVWTSAVRVYHWQTKFLKGRP